MIKRMIGNSGTFPKSFVICIKNNSFIVHNQSGVKKIQSIVIANLHDKPCM